MIFRNTQNKVYTVIDENGKERIVWDSRSVAVDMTILMINEEDHQLYVLVSKRGPKAADFKGQYNVVCGYLDRDETGSEAAVRETWEEVGLNIPDLVFNNPDIFLLRSDLDQPWFVNTDPSLNRQNVSLRYGAKFLNKSGKMPSLTIDNNEVIGEVESPQWMLVKDVDKYEWAFNHDNLIKDYVSLCSPVFRLENFGNK